MQVRYVVLDINLSAPIAPGEGIPYEIFKDIFPSSRSALKWKNLVAMGVLSRMIKKGCFNRPGQYRIVAYRRGFRIRFTLHRVVDHT